MNIKTIPSGVSWIRWILNHPMAILAVFLPLTLFFGYQLKGINVSKDMNFLFPSFHPNMVLKKKFNQMLASPDKLVCVLEVKQADIYTPQSIALIRQLTHEVMNLPGCDASDIKSITETSVKYMAATAWGVETHPIIFPRDPETPREFEQLKKRVQSDAGIHGIFVSYDGTAAAIMAKWKKGDNLKLLYRDLVDICQANTNEKFKVHFAGAPALGAHLVHLTGQIKPAALWMLILLLAGLVLYQGSLTGILLSLTTMVLSIVWAGGMAAVLGISIHFLALVWVLFFCGICTSFSAFCFNQYRYCSMVVSEKQSALEAGFANSLMPGGLGFLVFWLSCLTLSVSDLALLSGTGYLGACWALSGGIIVLVMNPIFLWFLPISKPRAISKSNIVFKESKSLAVLVVLVLVAAGAFGATRLKIGNNEPGSAFFFSDHPYNRAFSFFNEKFIGAYNMTIVVEGRDKGALNNAETMELIREFQTYMENETDARACISIAMMIRLLNRVYHEGNPKWALIPNDQKDLSSLGGAIKMGGTAGKWLDNTWTHGSIQAMYGDDSSQLIEERLSKARAFVLAHPSDRVDFRLFTGFLGVIDVMNHAGARAYWTSLLGSLALVFLVCLFVFQRPGSCMVMGLTMAAPLAATWTVMVFKEICISIHTAPAAPLAIGLGSALGLGLASYYQNGQSRYTKPDSQNRLGDIFRARSLAGLVLIPAVMMLPWIFIHIRFMAESAALIAVFLLAQMIVAMVILSFLADDLNLEKEA